MQQQTLEQALLAERGRIIDHIRAMAERARHESYTPATGVALGAIIDNVADEINTFKDRETHR